MARTSRKAPEWPLIRPVKRNDGCTVWLVDTARKLGKQIRRRFPTQEEAERFADRMREEKASEGVKGFSLSTAQRVDAEQALTLLAGTGATLKEAAEFLRRHKFPDGGERTVREAVEEYLTFLERQKVRPRTLADKRSRLGLIQGHDGMNHVTGFTATFGGRGVKDVTAAEVERFLDANIGAMSDQTRRNFHLVLSAFFAFCQGKRGKGKQTRQAYRVDNPMDSIAKPAVDREMPGLLSVGQSRALLNTAEATEGRLGLLAYVALGLFCGVRSTELEQLRWSDVQLSKGRVTIPAKIAKKRRIRNVVIPENALTWLARAEGRAGDAPVAPPCLAERLRTLRAEAGIEEWPTNALRHSFGSYLFALTEDSALVAARMGQRGDEVLFEHYRALVDKEQAEEFFRLVPETEAKVLPFNSAAR